MKYDPQGPVPNLFLAYGEGGREKGSFFFLFVLIIIHADRHHHPHHHYLRYRHLHHHYPVSIRLHRPAHQVFLIAGRKRKKSATSNYLMSTGMYL